MLKLLSVIVSMHLVISHSPIQSMSQIALTVVQDETLQKEALFKGMLKSFFNCFFRPLSQEDIQRIEQRRKLEKEAEAAQTRFADIMARRQLVCKLIFEKKDVQAAEFVNADVLDQQVVHLAAAQGMAAVLHRMLDSGLPYKNELMLKSVVWAADAGQIESVETLYNEVLDYYSYEAQQHALRALIGAVKKANFKLVTSLVQLFNTPRSECSISRFAAWGRQEITVPFYGQIITPTPLRAAIEGNQIVILNYLLKNGARIGLASGESERALAQRLGLTRIEEIVSALDDELRNNSIFSLIDQLEADETIRPDLYRRLMVCPPLASVSVIDKYGDTILHRAAQIADIGLFNRIVTINSELIGVKNKAGQTPIMSAVIMNGPLILEALKQ